MSREVNRIIIDMVVIGVIALAIAVAVNIKVGAIAFIAMALNIFGIPLLFLGLPYWVIYVIIIEWLIDIYKESKRING